QHLLLGARPAVVGRHHSICQLRREYPSRHRWPQSGATASAVAGATRLTQKPELTRRPDVQQNHKALAPPAYRGKPKGASSAGLDSSFKPDVRSAAPKPTSRMG